MISLSCCGIFCRTSIATASTVCSSLKASTGGRQSQHRCQPGARVVSGTMISASCISTSSICQSCARPMEKCASVTCMSPSIAVRASSSWPSMMRKTRRMRSTSWPRRARPFPSASLTSSPTAAPALPQTPLRAPAQISRSPIAKPGPIPHKPMAWSSASTAVSQAKCSALTSLDTSISKSC
jgi:hypothetical protein